jgi:CheY-like chemotaxis protein/Tfp pilus assembly protein PilZ
MSPSSYGGIGFASVKKIIIADDNQTFLMYLGLLLKRLEFKVMPAESGLEVLRLLRLSRADLVILDVHMKTMDGFTALRYIKEDPQTSHVPVIMVSHDTDRGIIDKCKRLGCFDYIAKPLKVDGLHESLQRCFFRQKGTSRKFLRVPFKGKVTVFHDGFEHSLYTETLSEGGMYVIKEDPLPVGSEVAVKFELGERGEVFAKGKVIYTKKLFGDFMTLPPGMAIRFGDLTEDVDDKLKFFIQDVMAGDIFDGRDDGYFIR